jgi:hypothetical protein
MTNNIEMQLERWNTLQGRVKKLIDKFPSLLWSGYTQFSTREQCDVFHRFVASIEDKVDNRYNPVIDTVFVLDDDAEMKREIELQNFANHILFLERCQCYPTENMLIGVCHNDVNPAGVFIDRRIIRVESLESDQVTVSVLRLDAPDVQEVIPLKMFATSPSFIHVQEKQLFLADLVNDKIHSVIPIKPTWNEAQLNAMTELQRRAIEELIVI